MATTVTNPMTQGALTASTIKRVNEAFSATLSDDKVLTPEMQDLYLQEKCEKRHEQNQQFRQQEQLRSFARGGR